MLIYQPSLTSGVALIMFLSILALIVGILVSDFQPLVDYLKSVDAEILLNKNYLVPILIVLILLVIKKNYFISTYTDELIPTQLSILSLILTIVGLYVFARIMILGLIILIVSVHWNGKIIQQYYPKKRVKSRLG